jgi:hypothetical protein
LEPEVFEERDATTCGEKRTCENRAKSNWVASESIEGDLGLNCKTEGSQNPLKIGMTV